MFNLPEEFILPKVPHLNFKGLSGDRSKERVLSHLFDRIKEASGEMSGGDVGDTFPLPPSPSRAP